MSRFQAIFTSSYSGFSDFFAFSGNFMSVGDFGIPMIYKHADTVVAFIFTSPHLPFHFLCPVSIPVVKKVVNSKNCPA